MLQVRRRPLQAAGQIATRRWHAVWDQAAGGWISDAQVAKIGYTAFASKKNQAVTARLIVRRVP
jgi:hypothetical protein